MSKSAFPQSLFRDLKEDSDHESNREVAFDEGTRPTYDEYIQQRNRTIYKMFKDDFSVEELAETFKLTEEEILKILEK